MTRRGISLTHNVRIVRRFAKASLLFEKEWQILQDGSWIGAEFPENPRGIDGGENTYWCVGGKFHFVATLPDRIRERLMCYRVPACYVIESFTAQCRNQFQHFNDIVNRY